jgi:hypothetical protein
MTRMTAPAGKPGGGGAAAVAATAAAAPNPQEHQPAAGAKVEPCLVWFSDGKQPDYELTVRCSKQGNISEVKRAQLTVTLPGMIDLLATSEAQMRRMAVSLTY